MKTPFAALSLFLSALAVLSAAVPLSSSINLDAGATTSAVSDHIPIARSNIWSMLARAPTTIKAEVTFTNTDDKLPSDTLHIGVKTFLGLCAPRLLVNSAGSTEVEVSRWNKSPALSQKGKYYEFEVTFNDGSLSGMYTGRIPKDALLNFKQYGKQALTGRLIDPKGEAVNIKYGQLQDKITDNFGQTKAKSSTEAKSSKNVMFASGAPTEYKYDKPSPEPEPELPTPPTSEKKKKKKTKTDGKE